MVAAMTEITILLLQQAITIFVKKSVESVLSHETILHGCKETVHKFKLSLASINKLGFKSVLRTMLCYFVQSERRLIRFHLPLLSLIGHDKEGRITL